MSLLNIKTPVLVRVLAIVLSLSAILGASSDSSRADWLWSAPNTGFVIQTTTPQGIPQKSGTSAKITGTITWIGKHDDDGSHDKKDSGEIQDNLRTSSYCPTLSNSAWLS